MMTPNPSVHASLALWANFYLITGTAAAALTGLQFVVQTLLASESLQPVGRRDPEGGIAAFGTPTVVHFAMALVLSAVLCAPWTHYAGLRATLGAIGIGTLIYSVVVLRRTQKQESYVPVFEDWLFHVILPGASYLAVLATAIFLAVGETGSLFLVAAATLVLICVGIHNAWDTVTYLLMSAVRHPGERG